MVKTSRPHRKRARKNSLRDADKELIRRRFEKERQRWHQVTRPMIEAAQAARRVAALDLAIMAT